MPDKEVYINSVKVGYCTKADATPEINNKSTQTFDGPVNSGLKNIPHTIEIEKLRYGDFQSYMEMYNIIESMYDTPVNITIKETVRTKNEVWTRIDHYNGCILDGNKYSINAEDQTVETIGAKAEGKETEWEN